MTTLALTESELEDIAEALDSPEVMEKFKVKLLVLRMHHEGIEHGVIARAVSKHPNTITSYLQEYADGGLSASLEDRAYRPSSALLPFMQCLRCSFAVNAPSTAKYAVTRIAALTGITLSEEQARRLMRRLGMRYRKTASIPGKSDPQMQFDFLRNQMEARLIEAAHGQRKVFFVDAAHFVLGCFLGMIWSFDRLFIKGTSGRQRYNVLGAVDSHSKEVITVRTIDNINALTICQLLEVLASKHSTIPVTLILDNARYQRCECVQTRAAELGIELLFLPAYSPNLNLIERLWKLTKTNSTIIQGAANKGTLTIAGRLSGGGSLTHNGSFTVSLTNATNSFSGALNVNGPMSLDSPGTLGSLGGLGSVNLNSVLSFPNGGVFNSRPMVVAAGGGTVNTSANTNWTQAISGGILSKTGLGTFIPGFGTGNDGFLVLQGTLQVSSDNNLGNPFATTTLDGGDLLATSSFLWT